MRQLPEFLLNLTGEGDKPSFEYASEIFSLLETVKIKKRQVLLHIGEVSDRIYIINNGIIKTSYLDEEGVLHTVRFNADNDVVTSMYSFSTQTPSALQLECLEAGEIMIFKYNDFQYMGKLYAGLMPSFYSMMMKRFHQGFDEKCRMIGWDATVRYVKFAERYEEIIDRLPLKEVASFLGIRQQSLSRLRAKLEEEGKL